MDLRLFLSSALFLLTSSGCSSLPAEQCRGQDWYQRGYDDAAAGQSTRQFLVYQSGCAQRGITPGRTSYLAGWVDGQRPDHSDLN